MAISTEEIFISLYNPERIVPITASNAADEDRPAPTNTSLVMYALNPPTLYPRFLNSLTTPLISATVVPLSSSISSVFAVSIVIRSYPSDTKEIIPSSVFCVIEMASKLIDGRRTCPCWWSVWLPPTSVLPGAL